jgi:quercetin dioxygenase-like cupin family protein
MRKHCELEIEDLKKARQSSVEALNKALILKNSHLAEYLFKKHRAGSDITFTLLNEIEVGETLPLPVVHGGAILTTKQPVDKDDEIQYRTEWTAGATLTWHYHSDCLETIILTEGIARVYLEGEVIEMHKGDSLKVAAGTGHQVTALENSKMDILFKRVSRAQLSLGF